MPSGGKILSPCDSMATPEVNVQSEPDYRKVQQRVLSGMRRIRRKRKAGGKGEMRKWVAKRHVGWVERSATHRMRMRMRMRVRMRVRGGCGRPTPLPANSATPRAYGSR